MPDDCTPRPRPRRLRVLLATLEFADPIFSGNGVYSRSLVRGLLDHGVDVRIYCGKPENDAGLGSPAEGSSISHDGEFRLFAYSSGRHQTPRWPDASADTERPVAHGRGMDGDADSSAGVGESNGGVGRTENVALIAAAPLSVWGRLDRHSAWQEFSDKAPQAMELLLNDWRPDVIVGVDWTALGPCLAAQRCHRHAHPTCAEHEETRPIASHDGRSHGDGHSSPKSDMVSYVYMNFRVFSLSDAGDDDRHFYAAKERVAVLSAVRTIALSQHDADALRELVLGDVNNRSTGGSVGGGRDLDVRYVLPPLRAEMLSLAGARQQQSGPGSSWESPARVYLTCCVRLSPEKNPMFFVEVVEQLAAALEKARVVPLIMGADSDPAYARAVKERLRAAVPTSEIVDFCGAAQLADAMSRTLINFHPCEYDAFGMTIVEAAAFGAPSVVCSGGRVGATELLRPAQGEVVELDFVRLGAAGVSERIQRLLLDRAYLEEVGTTARARATSWTEDAASMAVLDLLRGCVPQCTS